MKIDKRRSIYRCNRCKWHISGINNHLRLIEQTLVMFLTSGLAKFAHVRVWVATIIGWAALDIEYRCADVEIEYRCGSGKMCTRDKHGGSLMTRTMYYPWNQPTGLP